MPDIHIEREHGLGLPRARELAFKWAEAAEDKLGMECTYEEGRTSDLVSFTRAGVSGELRVTRDRFELHARLGLLLGPFRERIENEITRNLDQLLQHGDPVAAFQKGVDEATARRAGGRKAAARPTKAARPAEARGRKA